MGHGVHARDLRMGLRSGCLGAAGAGVRESHVLRIFLWLLHLSRDTSRQADGTPFFAYLLLTGVARFLVEFIRIEPRLWLDLTEAQWIGLGTIATGAIGLLWVRRPAALAPAVAVLLTVSVLGCSGPKTAPEFVAKT